VNLIQFADLHFRRLIWCCQLSATADPGAVCYSRDIMPEGVRNDTFCVRMICSDPDGKSKISRKQQGAERRP
jgi:hypothetical protein